MSNDNKNSSNRIIVLVSLICLPVLAFAVDQTETLLEFVQKSWKISEFQFGHDIVMTTVPMRVSTYSTPAFIHRGQLDNMGGKSQNLADLCERQGGQWRYLGPPVPVKPVPSQSLPLSATMANAVNRVSIDDVGMQEIVKTGEKDVANDALKLMVRDMLKQPDSLVADALEYAIRRKWLGRFECRREKSVWAASISYDKWANRIDRNYSYKDVSFKIELTESK